MVSRKTESRIGSESLPALPFNFDGVGVRIIMRGNESWFVAADVCRALQLAAHKRSNAEHLDKLDEDEKQQIGREALISVCPGLNPRQPCYPLA